jgi:hypothetical protein
MKESDYKSICYIHQRLCELPQTDQTKQLLNLMSEVLGAYEVLRQPELRKKIREMLNPEMFGM